MATNTDRKVLAVLVRAALLLHRPSSWTKAAMARNKHGDQCDSTSSEAVRWCLRGAINRSLSIVETHGEAERFRARSRVLRDLIAIGLPPHESGPMSWNDKVETTHDDIIAALKRVIRFYKSRVY